MGINVSDIKFEPDRNRPYDFDWMSVILIFLAIGIIIGAIYSIFCFKESKVAQLIKEKSILSALIVENNGKKTQSIILGFYNPDTGKLAFIFLPERTRLKVDYQDKPAYDTIENIYFRGGMSVVRRTIERLTNASFAFTLAFDLGVVEKLVDLLEGMEVLNPNSLNYMDVDKRIFVRVPKGRNMLDGAKVKQMLFSRNDSSGSKLIIDNHQVIGESLLDRSSDIAQLLSHPRILKRLQKDVDTNFSKKDIRALIGEMEKVDSSRIVYYRMFGKNTVIKNESYVTPIENGKWLKERIENVKKFITDEGPAPIDDDVAIEILNGSGNPGQAQSLRNYFLEYGFNVVHYGNALRNDYEKTLVIDRIGRPSLAKRIADIINCKQVYTRIDESLMVDVTIIIGNDFEGKYVR